MTTDPSARRRLGAGAAIAVVVAALAVTMGIGVVRGWTAPAEIVAPVAVTATDPAEAVLVHVSGAVARPGLYRLSVGARVVDAVAAAGGFGDGADESGVNLARPVSDGEQLVVPVVGATDAVGAGEAAPASGPADGRVDLNTAGTAEFETLPRIGPVLADRIVTWRETNGRFTSVDDLLAVPGIGERMLEGLRDLVRV